MRSPYFTPAIWLVSSLTLFVSCQRDVLSSKQKAAASQTMDLTGQAVSLAVAAGTVPSFPVETVITSTVTGQTQATHINLEAGMASDAAGNIYICDRSVGVIRKYNPGSNTLSIYAGDGHLGFKNGPLLSAEFFSPSGLAFDAQGNLYVADEQNQRIRIITPAGMVSTYAGSGLEGFADGGDSVAKFNNPTGVAVDGAGTVYVADFGNNRIRRISKTHTVTQWAGSGTAGFADGSGTLASFNRPYSITVTAAGVAYVSDQANNRIRKIVSGVVTTLAGSGLAQFADGTGAAASFRNPAGVTVDPSGNVYLADASNNRMRKITAAGVVTTLAGHGSAGSGDGVDTLASFSTPSGIAVDPSGNIFVGDLGTGEIRKVAVQAAVRTLAGNGATDYLEGTGKGAHINAPYSISLDAAGTLFFEDGDRRFRKSTPAGVTSFLADGTVGDPGFAFNSNTGSVVDVAGNLYVADGNNRQIRKTTPAGVVTPFGIDTAVSTQSLFFFVSSLNFDAAGNMIYTNFANGTIRKISPAGVVSFLDSVPITFDAGNPFASWIYASTNDVAGNLYVAAAHMSTIYKVTPQGKHTVFFAGQPPASDTVFQPRGLAVDASGKVYVADIGNNRIVVFSATGQFLTQIGTGAATFSDGPVTQAAFKGPSWITINRATGILYVADQGNNRIRMMSQLP
jgi:trimeric autotransporter adhesin